jgi:hypothetical protein
MFWPRPWGPLTTDESGRSFVNGTPGLWWTDRHLIASDEEGWWKPALGYAWATENPTDLCVRPLNVTAP